MLVPSSRGTFIKFCFICFAVSHKKKANDKENEGERLFFIPQPSRCTCLLTVELVLLARTAGNNNSSPTEREIEELQNHT